jgi:hypothetical protein
MPDPAPARKPGKYQPLADWLAAYPGDAVTLTFAQVEAILGQPVPKAARSSAAWWLRPAPRARAAQPWRAAGWTVAQVNRQAWFVRFVHTPAAL